MDFLIKLNVKDSLGIIRLALEVFQVSHMPKSDNFVTISNIYFSKAQNL